MGTKQRKNAKKDDTAPADQAGEVKSDVGEQLERALSALYSNKRYMTTLYVQWRTQLLRMSYIIMLVILHQLQQPTTSCLKEIKVCVVCRGEISRRIIVDVTSNLLHRIIIIQEFNEIRKNSMEEPYSGFQATLMVLNDSLVEILGLVCGICLTLCLSSPKMNFQDFTTVPFRISCSCIPTLVYFYHFEKQYLGCLDDSDYDTLMKHRQAQAGGDGLDAIEKQKRGFPIIIVFHLITTLALYFMQFQARSMDENIYKMLKLKEELTEARQGSKKDESSKKGD